MRIASRRLRAVGLTAVILTLTQITATASSVTGTIGAGTLAFVSTPGNVTFSVTLSGVDQTGSTSLPIDVGDSTGSGIGWNITATSTTFTTGGGSPHTLSTVATRVMVAPTTACDLNATCLLASNGVSYPYSLPAGGTAPTATKLVDASAGTGLGDQTVTAVFTISIPASTYAGSYTSTWTFSLVAGP
jgi:hypothetical protein